MDEPDLQSLCETAQQQLMAMEYLAAERTLVRAEQIALAAEDYDSLSRLYLPLQEARRQRRQLCSEGVVRLDILASNPDDRIDADRIVAEYPQGQLLVAGWKSIEPAIRVRRIQQERSLYVETFLAAVYPIGDSRAVVIVPTGSVALPELSEDSIDQLVTRLPPHSIVIHENSLPRGQRRGTTETYACTMSMWEQLHRPFLALANSETDSRRKIDACRRAIEVDYACELAHQKLADVAKVLARQLHAPHSAGA